MCVEMLLSCLLFWHVFFFNILEHKNAEMK